MSKKRRRLLIAQAKQALIGNVNECPTCGLSEEPDYIDGTYSREYYNAYCNSCGTLTVHYSCTTSDASKVNTCRTFWCSVCGYTEVYCPLCGSVAARVTEKCPYGVHDMTFYRCVNCSAVVGDDGSDHVDCEDEGGESPAGDCFTCPTCSYENTSYYGSGYCRQCGFANLVRCTNMIDGDYCLQTFCSKCGEFNPLFECTSCDYYSWLTEPDTLSTDLTCQYCEQGNGEGDNAFAHECPQCGTLHCVKCGEPLESSPPATTCPICGMEATYYGEGICRGCGNTSIYQCTNNDESSSNYCGSYQFCVNCRSYSPALECTMCGRISWNPAEVELRTGCLLCGNQHAYRCICGWDYCAQCNALIEI